MTPLTFSIGDIHGRADLVRAALDAIARRAGETPWRIVFLGDYVDRGPDSRGVVELMLELAKDPRIVCLKGNHEALMVQALTSDRASEFDHWLTVGGAATLASYGVELPGPGDQADLFVPAPADLPDQQRAAARAAVPAAHLRWMAALPLTSGDGQRVFVHAGLMPDTPLDRQTEETCLWIRERFLRASPRHFDTHIVHGHSPAWDETGQSCEPELLPHRTNLDLGAWVTDRIGVGVFEADRPGGPVEVLIAHGPVGGPIEVTHWSAPAAAPPPDAAPRRSWRRLFAR